MAKNKLTRWARFYANGYDLSGDARAVDKLLLNYPDSDMTGWNQSIKNYLVGGQLETGIKGFQALMNDAALSSMVALQTAGTAVVASLLFGSMAEPVVGDLAYLLSSVEMAAPAEFEGGAGALKVDFLPKTATGWPLGIVLLPKTAITVTTTGTTINNGAASLNGWHANLHLFVVGSANYAFVIQHSTDNFVANTATLGTFTTTGGAIGGEALSGTGTVNQYVRVLFTRTGGTCTVACTFARN